MNKIALMINKIEEINSDVDAIIVGLKNYNSLNLLELDIENIKTLKDKIDKKIFISINKLIHDNEIKELESILIELDKLEISGILFDDLSILQIVKEKKLNSNLIWANIHQVTNYNTINSYLNLGVNGAFISPDITLKEIIEIKNNTKAKIFVPIYGMFEIFSSNRFLLSNYLKYINYSKKDENYYIENKNIKYPIFEDENGTHIINGNIVNGLNEYIEILKNNCEYIVLNSYGINNLDKVIQNFKKVKSMYVENNINEDLIKNMSKCLTENINKGFLYTETIYKVKSDVNE